jgi:hypothetical protein
LFPRGQLLGRRECEIALPRDDSAQAKRLAKSCRNSRADQGHLQRALSLPCSKIGPTMATNGSLNPDTSADEQIFNAHQRRRLRRGRTVGPDTIEPSLPEFRTPQLALRLCGQPSGS